MLVQTVVRERIASSQGSAQSRRSEIRGDADWSNPADTPPLNRTAIRSLELFPEPSGVAPKTHCVAREQVARPRRGDTVADVRIMLTRTWRNPVNYAYEQRRWYRALAPKIEAAAVLYKLTCPNLAFSKKAQTTMARAVRRAGGGYAAIAGDYEWTVLSDVALPGAERVDDPVGALETAMCSMPSEKVLHRMRREEGGVAVRTFDYGVDHAVHGPTPTPRLRPIRTSRNWSLTAPSEESDDAGREQAGFGDGGRPPIDDTLWNVVDLNGSSPDPEDVTREAVARGFEVEEGEPLEPDCVTRLVIRIPLDAEISETGQEWRDRLHSLWQSLRTSGEGANDR